MEDESILEVEILWENVENLYQLGAVHPDKGFGPPKGLDSLPLLSQQLPAQKHKKQKKTLKRVLEQV